MLVDRRQIDVRFLKADFRGFSHLMLTDLEAMKHYALGHVAVELLDRNPNHPDASFLKACITRAARIEKTMEEFTINNYGNG